MTDSIAIWQCLCVCAAIMLINVGCAYWWASECFLRGYRAAQEECRKLHTHRLANQMRNANPRPWSRSATSRFHRE